MKFLLDLFDKFRPEFEGKKGRLKTFKPLFEVIEFAIFYPSDQVKHSPHVRDPLDLKRYMGVVLLAMAPCIISSVIFFGPYVLAMILVSYAVGGIAEVAFAIIRKGEVHEGFFVTGMIFPLILPPTTPLWMVGVGILFGVVFGKEIFGGTGRNPFNPALVARIFVTVAFPAAMTTQLKVPFSDAITSASPMALFKTQGVMTGYQELLMGQTAGSMGEIFHLGIILGGIFLMITKVSNWRIPVSYLGSVLLLSWIGHNVFLDAVAPPLFQLLAGGLLFGAMFMATDPVTCPYTRIGKYIFGILCGFLTVLIRGFSGYVEGVMFSIVIMNAFTPLLDHIILMVKYKQVQVKA